MTIDNHSDRGDQFGASPASHAEAHSRIALEQSALFAARLAIARWVNPASTSGASHTMAQAEWFARAQREFQEWLGRGGFAQYEDDCGDLVTPTMYTLGAAAVEPAKRDVPKAAA